MRAQQRETEQLENMVLEGVVTYVEGRVGRIGCAREHWEYMQINVQTSKPRPHLRQLLFYGSWPIETGDEIRAYLRPPYGLKQRLDELHPHKIEKIRKGEVVAAYYN